MNAALQKEKGSLYRQLKTFRLIVHVKWPIKVMFLFVSRAKISQ